MTIRYKCDECGAVLNIKDELAGTLGHCPRCKVEFQVPAPDGTVTAGKESATVAGKPAAEGEKRPAGAFSEDDIENILGAPGAVKSAGGFDSGDEFDEGASDADDELSTARTSRRSDDSDDGGVDDDDESDSDRRRKNKSKNKGSTKAKGDSEESAAIARNLMGRGDHAAARDEKRGGRPFGGAEGGRDEVKREYTITEVAGYFAKHFWPVLAGCVVLLGICIWLYYSLTPGVNLPSLVRVTGTVTMDGKPLKKALVKFQPIPEAGAKLTQAMATAFGFTDDNGKYELVYMVINEKQIFGAPLGQHQVVITANDSKGIEIVPLRYSYGPKSVLRATVAKGMPPQDFDLSSKEEAPAEGAVR
jgi:hypothetical protein